MRVADEEGTPARRAALRAAAPAVLPWPLQWPLHHPMVPRAVRHRHVVEHHGFFTHDAMAVDGWVDLRWVLFPPWALPLLVASVAPVALLVAVAAGARPAWLLALTVIGYYGLYEILHALAHWPPSAPLAGAAVVRRLTAHHRVHHDPALMGRWNFNFAIPIFDRLFGTT